MILDQIVKIGEIFEIWLGESCVRTKLQEVLENNHFVVFQPTVKGVPIRAEGDQVFQFSFSRSNGIYKFNAEMKKTFTKDGLKLCLFIAVSEVEKIQRRQSYRLPIALNVMMQQMGCKDTKVDSKKRYKGKTVNISEKSVLITCFSSFPEGTKLNVEIKLTEIETITLQTEVFLCKKPLMKNDPYNTVLLFLKCLEKDRASISRYILQQQIIVRKKNSSKSNGKK